MSTTYFPITCPICQGAAVVIEYDYGREPQTGYQDAGRRFRCYGCDAALADEEIDRAFEDERAGMIKCQSTILFH